MDFQLDDFLNSTNKDKEDNLYPFSRDKNRTRRIRHDSNSDFPIDPNPIVN